MNNDQAGPVQSVSTRVFKGALWLTAARVIVSLFRLLSTLVMARLLTPADFGLIAIISAVLAVVSAATSLPLATVLVQVENLTKQHLDTAWTMAVLRGLLTTTLIAIIAYPLSRIYGDTRIFPVMLALSTASLISGFSSTGVAILTRDLQFWQDFVLQSFTKGVGFVAGVLVAWLTHSYWALVAGSLAGTLAASLMSYAITRYRPAFDLSEWRTLFGFSAWLTLSELVNTANWRADQAFIGWRLGPSDLGYYTVGGDLAALVTREATAPLTQTLFPAFAKKADNRRQLAAAVARTQGLLVALALPIGVGFALLADRIVPVILGAKWSPVIQVIQIISCLYGIQTISLPARALAMAKRQNRTLFIRDLIILITRIPFVIGGMILFGLTGALWGRAFAGSLHLLMNLELIKRVSGLSLQQQFSHTWRSVLSVLAMSAAVLAGRKYFTSDWGGEYGTLAGLGLIGGVTYTVIHFTLWRLFSGTVGVETDIIAGARKLLSLLKHPLRTES